jgi:hypothetical protein
MVADNGSAFKNGPARQVANAIRMSRPAAMRVSQAFTLCGNCARRKSFSVAGAAAQ